ncbi:MAG: hypothetical protein A2073_03120 [Deltaproteobacteria bacterium GWC2_42_11]|nr:MAG: hypothetical protein A2073_03120 [Deltaproteobacteria bacterium GWC2_42_11]
MIYPYKGLDNLPRFVTFSAVIHVMVIGGTLYLLTLVPAKKFITPVYTVDLIGHSPEKPVKKVVKPDEIAEDKIVKHVPADIKQGVEESKPIIKSDADTTKKTETAKKTSVEKAIPIKEKVKKDVIKEDTRDIDIAVSKLAEKVKKEEQEEKTVQERIKEIETGAVIQRRIDELKKDIEKREAIVRGMVKISPPLKHIESKSNTADSKPAGMITRELIELEEKAYYFRLAELITSNWIFPNEYRKDLKIVIVVKINRSGGLIEKWLEEPSGNTAFDKSLVRAIEKSVPFPPPPDGVAERFSSEGVGFRFCSGGCEGE